MTSPENPALTRLLDDAAIRDVIVRFGDAAVRADYAEFATLWADDAEWVIGGTEAQPFERRAEGRDDIVSLFRNLRDERDYFVHFVIPLSIEIAGNEATTRSLCSEAARGTDSYYRTNGVWTDRLSRSDDGWVFTKRDYHFLWLDLSPYSGDVFPV